ncbi:hypothetical protein LDDCCGHA_4398 [Methylobacterium oxalidis]|nr:hypothetical protein LDDCCGHA_4398 [Methylobacterium oxalidis]
MGVGGLDLLLREAEEGQQLEGRVGELLGRHLQRLRQEVVAERPAVEDELDVEGRLQPGLHRRDLLVGEALGPQAARVDARSLAHRAVADRVGLDLGDLGFAVAERAQRVGHGPVDDLEVAAARELLELHQREVGLDAGGVAIHHEADRAGRRDHGRLRVAVAVLLAEGESPVPHRHGALGDVGLRHVGVVEGDGGDAQELVALGLAVGGAAVVADDAQHRVGVLGVFLEGAELGRHLGGGGVGGARHDGAERAGERAPFRRVVGQAHRHQQAADVRVAEAERPVAVGQLGDLLRGELRHHHRDLEHHRPQAVEVLEGGHVEVARLAVVHRQQVRRGEVAGRVVEEHVLGARVRGPDPPARRAGVPVVHRRVEVQARVGRGPGRLADLLPEVAGLERLRHLAGGAGGEVPVGVRLDGAQEVVGERDRVVGVLAGHRQVGFRIPVGVVDRELDLGEALAGELHDALDVGVRHHRLAGGLHLALEGRVALGVEAGVALRLALGAGPHHGLEVLRHDLGAGHEGRDLLLLLHLPVDVLLDVGVVDVDDDHLGGAARGAAGLDRARRAVADAQEAHQARRLAAAAEALVLAAQQREVRARARAVLEQAGFPHPQVHDAALVHEVVLHGLDEAGVGLRVLVGALRLRQRAGAVVAVIVTLARPVDAVGPVQAGVEPLRRVRRHHLPRQHEAQLVEEGGGVLLRGEVAALPAPVGPAAGEPVEHLAGRDLGAGALLLGQLRQRRLVGQRAPEEARDVVLLDLLQAGGHAGLAEVLLREDVGRDLAPALGHVDALQPEHHRAVRVADLAQSLPEGNRRVGRLTRTGVAPLEPHETYLSRRDARSRPATPRGTYARSLGADSGRTQRCVPGRRT